MGGTRQLEVLREGAWPLVHLVGLTFPPFCLLLINSQGLGRRGDIIIRLLSAE